MIEMLTPDQWRERIKTNKVYQSMTAVAEIARLVAHRKRSSAIISGPPGVGKTWAFERALKARGLQWHQPQVASAQALIAVLSQHPNAVFLFDECDFMLKNINILNILKRVIDSKLSEKRLQYDSRNKNLAIPPFKFTGRIVFLTNMKLNSDKILNDRRLGDHIRAINDRCEPYNMSFDHKELWEYTCYLVIAEKMLWREGIGREATNMALRYFTKTMWRRDSVSPRAITLLARSIERSPVMWRDLADQSLLSEPHTDAPVPPIPQLRQPVSANRMAQKRILKPKASRQSAKQ